MYPNNFNPDEINNQQTLPSRNLALITIRLALQLIIRFVQLSKQAFHTLFTSLIKPMPQSFNQKPRLLSQMFRF